MFTLDWQQSAIYKRWVGILFLPPNPTFQTSGLKAPAGAKRFSLTVDWGRPVLTDNLDAQKLALASYMLQDQVQDSYIKLQAPYLLGSRYLKDT